MLTASFLFSCAPNEAAPNIEDTQEQAPLLETSSASSSTTVKEETKKAAEEQEVERSGQIMSLGVSTTGYGIEYMILADSLTGEFIREVTDENYNSYSPEMAPDGKKILFYSDDDGDYDVYIINTDGTGLKNITDNDYGDFIPRWSNDGTKICFSSDEMGNTDVTVMNSDGSGKDNPVKNNKENYGAVFSPDNSRIFYVSNEEGDCDIYSIGINGSDKQKHTNDEYFENDLSFSPDGSKIVYRAGFIDSMLFKVFVLDLLTGGTKQLTETMSYGRLPLWAEEGKSIVFNSDMYPEIYIMNANGEELRNITNNDMDDRLLDVSPDGARIFYQSFNGEISTEVLMFDISSTRKIKILETQSDAS